MKNWFYIAGMVLALGACASTPATQYYSLSDSAYRLPASPNKQTVVLRVVLSEALKSHSLLYQNDAHTLHFAKQHLWAEPLDIAIRNQLANELNAQSAHVRFVPAHLKSGNMPELTVYIERFHGRFDGQTQITGYSAWQRGGQMTPSQSFNVLTPQQGDGHAAMVTSLNQGLQQVASQLSP